MMARRFGCSMRLCSWNTTAFAAALLLAACAMAQGQTGWVKAGVDDATATREVNDCQAQAAAVQNTQQGINQDRSATLGRNWALSYTTNLQVQTMQQQTAAIADQAFNNCMRAKGFTRRG